MDKESSEQTRPRTPSTSAAHLAGFIPASVIGAMAKVMEWPFFLSPL